MEKIKAPEYFCATCFQCGKPAKYFRGKLQGIKCYDSGLKKPVLIHAGFCAKHAISVLELSEDSILGDYNKDKMGPVLQEQELENYLNQAVIKENIKFLRENYSRNEKELKIQKEKEKYENSHRGKSTAHRCTAINVRNKQTGILCPDAV